MITWIKRLISCAINDVEKQIQIASNSQISNLAAYQDAYRQTMCHDVLELRIELLKLKREMLKSLIGIKKKKVR